MENNQNYQGQNQPDQNNPGHEVHGQAEPVCYRHPDRITFARCKHCNRPICGECQIHLEVGTICPECYREVNGRAYTPPTRGQVSLTPKVTYTLIGMNVVIYLAQLLIPDYWVYSEGALNWPWVEYSDEYYRVLTSGFLHSQTDYGHLVMNMVSLYIFGSALERMMGHGSFLAVYLLSILGGSAGVFLLSYQSTVVGASGGIYGLMGSFLVLMLAMKQRENARALMIMLAINVVYGFTMPNISWQAHLGGFMAGAVVTAMMIPLLRRRV